MRIPWKRCGGYHRTWPYQMWEGWRIDWPLNWPEVTVKRWTDYKTWSSYVQWKCGHSFYHATFEHRPNLRAASLAALNFLKRIGWKPEVGK